MDYITKPFSISALQRKIKAMFAMLEHHKPAKDIYEDGSLFLDFSEQFASLNGKPLALSAMEYKMLNLFLKNPKQVLTRQQFLEKLWDVDEKYVDEHTLTTSISRIRSKIEADGDTYIKTVYGLSLIHIFNKPDGYLKGSLSDTEDVDYYEFNITESVSYTHLDVYKRQSSSAKTVTISQAVASYEANFTMAVSVSNKTQ